MVYQNDSELWEHEISVNTFLTLMESELFRHLKFLFC